MSQLPSKEIQNDFWEDLKRSNTSEALRRVGTLLKLYPELVHCVQNGNTALHYAVDKNNTEMTRFLLEKGADPSLRSASGKTPLHIAASNRNLDIARILIEKGSDVTAISSENGETALHIVASQTDSDSSEFARFLLQNNCDLPQKMTSTKQTPLHSAAASGNTPVARLLIEKGASIGDLNSAKNTPLHLAANRGHTSLVRLLIEHGADVNAKGENGYTPLHSAIRTAKLETIRLLVTCGADITIKDDNNRTPAGLARHLENEYTAQLVETTVSTAPSLRNNPHKQNIETLNRILTKKNP